jgi:hypothetical protein
MTTSPDPINLFEFEDVAKERLPKEEYDYIVGNEGELAGIDRPLRRAQKSASRGRARHLPGGDSLWHRACGERQRDYFIRRFG